MENKPLKEIVCEIDEYFTGERTPVMLEEYISILSNIPLVTVEQASKQIRHKFTRWVTLDQWLNIIDNILLQEKKREPAKTLKKLFDFNRLPQESKTNIAKFCCDLVQKRLNNKITVKEMAEEMIKGELAYPNLGLGEQGASLLHYAEKTK